MILEKIKEHAGKISFFVISVLLIIIGVQYLNQASPSSTVNQQSSTNTNDGLTGKNGNVPSVNAPSSIKVPSSKTRVS